MLRCRCDLQRRRRRANTVVIAVASIGICGDVAQVMSGAAYRELLTHLRLELEDPADAARIERRVAIGGMELALMPPWQRIRIAVALQRATQVICAEVDQVPNSSESELEFAARAAALHIQLRLIVEADT